MQSCEISSHLVNVLDPTHRTDTIDYLKETISPYKDKFDAIVVCGASGMLAGVTIADYFQKDIILVRKPDDDSHSLLLVEGVKPGRYIIIDDLISSGKTLTLMNMAMQVHCQYSECVGIVLYHHTRSYWYQEATKILAYHIDRFPAIRIGKTMGATCRRTTEIE